MLHRATIPKTTTLVDGQYIVGSRIIRIDELSGITTIRIPRKTKQYISGAHFFGISALSDFRRKRPDPGISQSFAGDLQRKYLRTFRCDRSQDQQWSLSWLWLVIQDIQGPFCCCWRTRKSVSLVDPKIEVSEIGQMFWWLVVELVFVKQLLYIYI